MLCHLIDKNKMDICNIKISEITDQYIAYLNAMEELNLEIASEFLMMASTLLYLKSKTLLPNEVEEEKELTEEELLRRIIEYKKYKEITKTLRECLENNSKKVFKNPEVIELPKQKLEATYTKEMISMQRIGYKKMIKYLDGEYTYDEAIEIIKRDSRRYAKRQLTWFKRYQDAKWFDLDKYQDIEILKEDIINHIEKLLEIV